MASKSKKFFFNAEHDEDTKRIFSQAVTEVPRPKEVQVEAPPINPFEALETRNRQMDQARLEAAKKSDPSQVLVREPTSGPTKIESVQLDELPAIVRQAAEAALLKKLNARRRK